VVGVGGGGTNAVNRMVDAGKPGVHHAVHRVRASAADADDLEDREVIPCLAHETEDGSTSSWTKALGLSSASFAAGYAPDTGVSTRRTVKVDLRVEGCGLRLAARGR